MAKNRPYCCGDDDGGDGAQVHLSNKLRKSAREENKLIEKIIGNKERERARDREREREQKFMDD